MKFPFAFWAASKATITSVNFALGDTDGGGQSIVITGTNLSGATTVTFGAAGATITGNTPTSVTVTLPAHVSGSVTVTVNTPAGSPTTSFEYWTPAQITNIDGYWDSDKGVTQVAGAVSAWLDQSVNALNATQATASSKPTQVASVFGTLPSIRFLNSGNLSTQNTG